MKYPSIEQYKDSIRLANHTLKTLSGYEPVFRNDGELWFSSGNFAVVFKLKHKVTGKESALKCFTRHQESRKQNFQKISECLKDYPSDYMVGYQYLEEELWVETGHGEDTEVSVLAMDWVNGHTMGEYVRLCCQKSDKPALLNLLEEFKWFAFWLLHQPFSHGDLKPDNIIISPEGKPVLLDYDGMFVPSMKGQQAQELGSPVYRYPQRTVNDFDKRMDDFALIVLLLELRILSLHTDKLLNSGESLCLSQSEISITSLTGIASIITMGLSRSESKLSGALLLLFEAALEIKDVGHLFHSLLFKHFKNEPLPEWKYHTASESSFIEPEMVFVEGGTFNMGSENGFDSEKPVHQVTLSDFYLGKYEVTVAEFRVFVNNTGYKTDAENGDGSFILANGEWGQKAGINWRHDTKGETAQDNHPVIHVNWNDAKAYCDWLSKKSGKTYRLPTEAEWEFGARGGKQSKGFEYAGSNNLGDVGWHSGNSGNKTHAVGEKLPNELGLYDMSGNVLECCSDWYEEYPSGSQTNPTGPTSGLFRVVRGGSWDDYPQHCRVAYRGDLTPDNRCSFLGFRLARTK
jgi:formylglycine-generating enzyme required for sulfatase activity/predicted Ser/Thr protein kinase